MRQNFVSVIRATLSRSEDAVTSSAVPRQSNFLRRLCKTGKALLLSGKQLGLISQNMAMGAGAQMAAVQAALASVTEMTKIVEHTANSSLSSLEEARIAKALAVTGGDQSSRAVQAMEGIKEANERLKKISEMISGMEAKTRFIDDIMLQTKLLAFNASIEASHVGASGRGFLIVAQSMKQLAEDCSKASIEIREVVTKCREQTVTAIDTITQRINEAAVITNQTNASFAQIAAGISRISTHTEAVHQKSTLIEHSLQRSAENMAHIFATCSANRKISDTTAEMKTLLTNDGEYLETLAEGHSENSEE